MLNLLEHGQPNLRRYSQGRYVSILGTGEKKPAIAILRTELMLHARAFTIQSMTVLLSRAIRGSRILSQQTGSTRRHTTEQFRIVRNLKSTNQSSADPSIATKPSCPQAILQFQHGTFIENSDGSLSLSPFSVDGRQLQSDPCSSSHATYTRYNQSERMEVSVPRINSVV